MVYPKIFKNQEGYKRFQFHYNIRYFLFKHLISIKICFYSNYIKSAELLNFFIKSYIVYSDAERIIAHMNILIITELLLSCVSHLP
jgi:hypothetical protein